MIPTDKLRRLEVKDPSGGWVTAAFGQVEEGDTIRLFEPDGSPVVGRDGLTEFTAVDAPSVRIREPEAA